MELGDVIPGTGVGQRQAGVEFGEAPSITGSQCSAADFYLGNWSCFILTAHQNIVKTELGGSAGVRWSLNTTTV